MDNTVNKVEDVESKLVKNQTVKNKLNIVCRGFIKGNKVGGEIISVIPDVPIAAYLDDLLFIVTIPNEEQTYAPTYIRLQEKSRSDSEDKVQQFTEIHSVGYVKQKKGEIIVCAPKTHVWVELNKIVFIATVPSEGKDRAPCYIKSKNADMKTKNEQDIEAKLLELVRQSPDGIRPSEVKIAGTVPGEVQSAALALATRGAVKVGTDWCMKMPNQS